MQYQLSVRALIVICRWMPPCLYPLASHIHREQIVELISHDRRAATNCQPDNTSSIAAPFEVALPSLTTRIEESDAAAGNRIKSVRLNAFVPIAKTARQPQIIFVVCPAESFRIDVLYFEEA
jgi:hypothetical protein